jgi:nucleoside-diphosphate-sugar epimerase
MKILIIGGTGLISTAITRELIERGEEITLYNRGQTEARVPAGANYLHGDRKDYAAFEAQMAEAGSFDCVIDMICFLPEEAESAIRAFKGRVGQFIFCSTVDVYNRPANRYPITEAEPYGAASLYGQNKVKCEQRFFAAHEQGELPVTIIRPAHTYGEGGRIIHTFGWGTGYLDRIRKGKPIVVHGDGNSLWASCHIDDVGHAFVGAIGNAQNFGKGYHVTGEEWQSWNRYHRGVAAAMNAPEPTLVHVPADLLVKIAPTRAAVTAENFQFNNIFDNTAAKTDLDFRYTIPWIEGARRTINWLDERGRIDNSDDDPFDDRLIDAWQRLGAQMAAELQ